MTMTNELTRALKALLEDLDGIRDTSGETEREDDVLVQCLSFVGRVDAAPLNLLRAAVGLPPLTAGKE